MMNAEKNENPMTVMHVCVSGEYSDYRIVSMWSSKEAAKAECERVRAAGEGYDVRVEEYFLNVSKLDGARREVEGYRAVYELRDSNDNVTAADVTVKNDIFNGESEDTVHFIKGTRYFKSFVSAHSGSKENAVRLVLDKVTEINAASK